MVVPIPLTELHPFPNHPFKVRDDEAMKETTESVKEYGVLTPAIVRPREKGGYEIVAGHRRKRACELAGLTALPALVRNLDDDTATILMVDSNIQRENILPSERAQAYKMKLEAIKRRAGRRTKEAADNSPNNSANFRSDDEIGAAMGMSGDTVRNYISLTQLVPELQQMVDDKKIAVTPAYQIAALKPEEQALLVETIESEQATPSVSQAQRMKKLSQSGELNEDTMLSIMSAEKKPEVDKIVLTGNRADWRYPPQILPPLLHAPEDGGNHHQTVGGVAEEAPAQSGTLIKYGTGTPDRESLCPVFSCPVKETHVVYQHISIQAGACGLPPLHRVRR